MKKLINSVRLEGYLYNHSLTQGVTGSQSKHPGTTYIRGKIDIATNDECDNIVSVYYTYVTPTTAKGKPNATYTTLLNIIEGRYKTIMGSSKDEAFKLRVDTSIGVNDYYVERDGQWELVSGKRNVDGFIHQVNGVFSDDKERNKFEVDMLITSCTRREGDPERDIPEKVVVKGAVFNGYRGTLIPVELSALADDAMDYFESLDASSRNPIFTKVRGKQISTTIVRRQEEESAFGANYVREVPVSRRDFVINWANSEPYVWDDESTMTVEELKKMMSDREMYLATKKQDAINYKESKNNTIPTNIVKSTTSVASGEYDF